MYVVQVPGRKDRRYMPGSITPRQAVANGEALLDFVSSNYNRKIPFGVNWKQSLVTSGGALLFSIDTPKRCLICRLCNTTREKDPYLSALSLLDVEHGWLYGFDLPPGRNAHYHGYDGTQDQETADRLIAEGYAVLHEAWEHVLCGDKKRSRRAAFVSALA